MLFGTFYIRAQEVAANNGTSAPAATALYSNCHAVRDATVTATLVLPVAGEMPSRCQ